MIFPENINIKILNNGINVCGLICFVKFLTFQKNDYPLGVYKTDDEGSFIISKNLIEKKIQESNELFIMDYDCSDKNFSGNMKITIECLEDIYVRIKNIEKFFPEKAIELISILDSNVNKIISFSISQDFPIKKNIEYDIYTSLPPLSEVSK